MQLANTVAADIRASGGHAIADSSPFSQGDRIIAAALARFGRLDAIILNNGYSPLTQWDATERGEWDSLLDSTFRSAYKVSLKRADPR